MKPHHFRSVGRSVTFRPRLEALENRWCPSCIFTQDGDMLFITGDRTDDRLEIVDHGGRGLQVICDGSSQTFTGITQVVGDLGGGKNNLNVDLDAQTNVESLSFKSGSGDDLVTAGFGAINGIIIDFDLGAGDDTFTATFNPTESVSPAPSDLPPGPCKLDVFGQQGNDRLSLFLGGPETGPAPHLFNAELAVNFDGSAGSDNFVIAIIDVVVDAPMSLSFDGGLGDEAIVIDWRDVTVNAAVTQTMNLGGGDDIAALNAYNVAFNADAVTNVLGGDGGDTIGIIWCKSNAAPGASLAVRTSCGVPWSGSRSRGVLSGDRTVATAMIRSALSLRGAMWPRARRSWLTSMAAAARIRWGLSSLEAR